MRWLLCQNCLKNHLPAGSRQILAQSREGEPAEYQRLTLGTAGQPKTEQRFMEVNGVRFPMGLAFYNCDSCDGEIKPGDSCAGWTVWVEGQAEPKPWEYEFFANEVRP